MCSKKLPAKARESVAGVVGTVPLPFHFFIFLLVPVPATRYCRQAGLILRYRYGSKNRA